MENAYILATVGKGSMAASENKVEMVQRDGAQDDHVACSGEPRGGGGPRRL